MCIRDRLTEDEIRGFDQIYIVACGSAWHVGMAAQYVDVYKRQMYILLVVQFIVCLGGFTIVPVIIQLIILVALIAANRKLIINIMRKGKIMLAKYLQMCIRDRKKVV